MQNCLMIGSIKIKGDVILAPMEGVSDYPYRQIGKQFGSAINYTEFVNAIEILNGHPYRVDQHLSYSEFERPISFQLFDADPDRIIQAALAIVDRNPDFIDINLGCAAKKVSNRGAGSGLLRTPDKIQKIFSSLSQLLDIPITGKIRLGWDEESKNYLEIAKILEDNGAQMLAVHGRTRDQNYMGNADWDAIAEIKQAIKIPVIGNGDIQTVDDIGRMKEHTNCDAVMIGRASIGNPWILAKRERNTILPEEVRSVIFQHLDLMVDFYGEHAGILLLRKHLVNYIRPYPLTREEKKEILTAETRSHLISLLDSIVFN